jgi:ankyrin repeat protein
MGDTPLHCAAYAGSQAACVWLLTQGSRIEAKNNVRHLSFFHSHLFVDQLSLG